MKEVFCKNCRFIANNYLVDDDVCRVSQKVVIAKSWYRILKRLQLCRDCNADNDCKNYKQKWWQKLLFWIDF